jgi:trans-aconitate methyltransferase
MSEAFEAASKHPVGKPVLFSAWAILTAHLFGLIPDHYDPIDRLWHRLAPKGRLARGTEA